MASNRVIHQFLYRIRTSPHVVLQYNNNKNDLVTWFWWVTVALGGEIPFIQMTRPTNEHGECVPPSELCSHRLSHNVQGPCCPCPLQNNVDKFFMESTICMVHHGRYAGEYVATCAKDECDYFGISSGPLTCSGLTSCPVFVEWIYGRRGVPIHYYPL
jgi:hypothetical protein